MNASTLVLESLTVEQQQCLLEAFLENEKEERLASLLELKRRQTLLSVDGERPYTGDKQSN